jgi:adenylyltransferase/sulfurtransferase
MVPSCAVCGDAPTVTAPIDYEAFCGVGPSEVAGVPTISVEEFEARCADGEHFDLLDVRERHEWEIARIPGATLFPMSEVASRLHELDSARAYTLSCHRGVRSLEAYHLLRRAGFEKLTILEGGVDAWAERVDPTMRRY